MRRKAYSFAMRGLMALSVAITCGFALFIILYVLCKGLPNITWQLLSTSPSILNDRIGILPDILNTLYLILAALAVVLPLGVGAAVYLTEYASSKRLVSVIEYAAETLSGIPSIIYGFVGMMLFAGTFGTSLLAGALTLVIMNLPTVMRTAQERLNASVGRFLGESAALLFTAGFAHVLNGFFTGLGSSGASLTVAMYVYAKDRGEFEAAFAIAAILLVLTLLVNLCAALAGWYFKERRA